MTFTAAGLLNEAAFDSAVRLIEKDFSEYFVRIGYTIAEDFNGEPSVVFRILVRDEFAEKERLKELARRVELTLMNDARTYENGLTAYFEYRSVSGQKELKDPLWD